MFHGLSSEHGHFSHQIGQVLAGQVTSAGGSCRTDLSAALADDRSWTKAIVGRLNQELAFLGRQKIVAGKDRRILMDLLQSWIHDVDAVENWCGGVPLRSGRMVLLVLVFWLLSHHGDNVVAAVKMVVGFM